MHRRVVLVTGAARGIGKEIARQLAERGATRAAWMYWSTTPEFVHVSSRAGSHGDDRVRIG